MSSPARTLCSVANFVRPEEQAIFAEFETGYMAELSPASPLEETLSREIIHAAWRLRRCADLEATPPKNMADDELDRLQTSIDRARAAAQRTFHRSLKELRRLQTERLMATMDSTLQNFAKRTQSQPEEAEVKQNTAPVPRSAPCPCRSGQKYKRCCGRTAPPVLFAAAA